MTAILIVGAGRLQLPAYREAREMGLEIVAIDRDPNAPGMKLADTAHTVDTRDSQSAIDVARKEGVDGVLTLCTDFPVRTVAAVASSLGLPGPTPEVALRATHKGRMREAFARAEAPSPGFAVVRSEKEARSALERVGLPAIVKPSSSSGSRGVFKLERAEDLSKAFDHAQQIEGEGAEILVEEFVDGPEVSVEAVSFCGEHHVVAVTDKLTSGDPHWVELGHTQPSCLSPITLERIGKCAAIGLDALGIESAPSHVEIKVGPSGPVLIEIGARLGGDFISTVLTELSTGVSMTRAAIDLALGREPSLAARWKRAAAIRYLVPESGVVSSIGGIEKARALQGVEEVEVYLEVGKKVGGVHASGDRAGHLVASAESREEAVAVAERGLALIGVDTTGLGLEAEGE